MTTAIEKSRVNELEDLHIRFIKMDVGRMLIAVRMGQLLDQQKSALKGKKGAWTQWVDNSLSFKIRTCQYYMRYYRDRDNLKTHEGALLTITEARDVVTKHQAITWRPKRKPGLPLPFTGGKRLRFRLPVWIE